MAQLSTKNKELIAKYAKTPEGFKSNGSKSLGTEYTVTSTDLSELSFTDSEGKATPYIAWECAEKTSRGDTRVITPKALAAYSANAALTWEWLDGYDGSVAFKVTTNGGEKQGEEMVSFLAPSGKKKTVLLIGRARRGNYWVYAYGHKK